MRTVHVEKTHQCTMCEKAFKKALSLKVKLYTYTFLLLASNVFNLNSITTRNTLHAIPVKICTHARIAQIHLSPIQICINIERNHIHLNGCRNVKNVAYRPIERHHYYLTNPNQSKPLILTSQVTHSAS